MTSLKCIALQSMMTYEAFVWGLRVLIGDCLTVLETSSVLWWCPKGWSAMHYTHGDIKGRPLSEAIFRRSNCKCLMVEMTCLIHVSAVSAVSFSVMIQMTSLKCIALQSMMTYEAFVWGLRVLIGDCLTVLETSSVLWWCPKGWSAMHYTHGDIKGRPLSEAIFRRSNCKCLMVEMTCLIHVSAVSAVSFSVMIQMTSLKCIALQNMMTYEAFV